MYSEYSIIHNIIQSIDIYAVPVPLAVNSDIIDSRSCDHDHDRKFLFDFISSDNNSHTTFTVSSHSEKVTVPCLIES